MSMPTPVKKAMEFMNLYHVQSILEAGCGKGGIIAQFPASVRVGVDFFLPFLEEAKRAYPEILFLQHDVALQNIFLPGSFDAVIGFDILEHLPENRMHELVQACEDLARKLVIFFAPLDEPGLAMQPEPVEGNSGLQHVTIIRQELFIRRGYQTWVYPKYHNEQVSAMLAVKEM